MSKPSVLLSTFILCLLLVDPATADYLETNLVSDGSVAAILTDPNMKDPWGISFSTSSPFWISEQASNFQNVSSGNPSPVATLLTVPSAGTTPSLPALIVNIPNQGNAAADPTVNGPTGQVSTAAPGITTIGSDFPVVGPNGGTSHEASFIFSNMDGSISAWSNASTGAPIANTTATLQTLAVVPGASFTGLAIANNPAAETGGASGAQLYAADQNSGNIVVFNSSFQKIGSFSDPNLPAGYTAFNVQNIGGTLFVTYANQNNTLGGIVDTFSPNGTFLGRLIDNSTAITPHGNLDQPWGMALAPASFGQFGGDLLVGTNGGDGWINAFNPTTGAFVGSLTLSGGSFFHEVNLWALTFGNGGNGGNPNTLYFDAGLNAAGSDGLVGSITAVPEPGSILLIGIGGTMATVVLLRHRKGRIASPAAAVDRQPPKQSHS